MSGFFPIAALSAALALAPPAAAAAPAPPAAPARPAKLGLCAACHGDDGLGRVAGTPRLAGQDEAYLRTALTAYRTGSRRAAPMNSIAGTLNARDIRALARWYATRPPAAAR
jgi:cytochrome c553